MKIHLKENVLETALNRMRRLFDEFPNVVVGFSGGKDSTVTFHLALQVAREKNRLPLKVMWIDQEAEWQGTVDFCRDIMYHPDVDPYWYQFPMVITNNASSFNRYAKCWDPEEEHKWIHPKDPISKKENLFGTDRFHELFQKIFAYEFGDTKSCYLAGVRAEESPKRYIALTDNLTYKDITWGKKLDVKREHYTFYPLYDWIVGDIWKYILDNNIPYNKVYDGMYQHGVQINHMRISNVHHETALPNLMLIQEIEPKTWEKVCNRIEGANTIKHIKQNSYKCPDELPYMFSSWEEYCLYLADNIIQEDIYREKFLKKIGTKKKIYDGPLIKSDFWRIAVNTILSSDWDFTKLANFEAGHRVHGYRKYKNGRIDNKLLLDTKYFTNEEIQDIISKLNKQNERHTTVTED
jgi:predicted phosphoadenosine phosphosulfate sulfurtransferase